MVHAMLDTAFDHHSATFAADPFGACREMRLRSPVGWSSAHGGYWILTRYDDVMNAFRDYETFSSASGATIPDLSLGTQHIPTTVDPPDHSVYRKLLTQAFSRSTVDQLGATIRSLVRDHLERMIAIGSWDFVDDLALAIPGIVTLTLLGFPKEKRVAFSAAMERSMSYQGSVTEADVRDEVGWIKREIIDAIAAQRISPTGGLLSELVNAQFVDRDLTHDELTRIFTNLFVAGFHTVASAIGCTVVHLDREPAAREQLLRRPELIPSAIEELVRCYPPAMGMARTVIRPVEVGGVPMEPGDKVLLLIAAANRDPEMFEDPDRVDFERRSTSVAFGWGVHRCLGLHLARLTLRIEVEEILRMMPDFRIDHHGLEMGEDLGISYHYTRIPASLPG